MPLHENRSLVRLTIFLSRAERRLFKEYAVKSETSMNAIVVAYIRSVIKGKSEVEEAIEEEEDDRNP